MWTDYIVHMSNFLLGKLPFESLPYRENWKPFFESKICASNFRQNMKSEGLFCIWPRDSFIDSDDVFDQCSQIRDALQNRISLRHSTEFLEDQGYLDSLNLFKPSTPFIPRYGSLQLSARMIRYGERGIRREAFESILTNRTQTQDNDYWKHNPFGFARPTSDQRYWLIYMELSAPKNIFVKREDGTEVFGRFFVHIFPNGTVTLLFAVKTTIKDPGKIILKELIEVSRPWRGGPELWSDKKGNQKTLSEWLEDLKVCLAHSLFQNRSGILKTDRWISIYKKDESSESFQDYLNFSRIEKTINTREYSRLVRSINFGKQGTVVGTSECAKDSNKNRLRFTWNIAFLHEFVEIRRNVLVAYRNYMSSEATRLRNLRLNYRKKMKEDEVFRITQYNEQVLQYLHSLDQEAKNLKPFYRKIYSEICNSGNFDKLRKSTISEFDTWVKEVENWENPALVSVKAIFSPIRLILGG